MDFMLSLAADMLAALHSLAVLALVGVCALGPLSWLAGGDRS